MVIDRVQIPWHKEFPSRSFSSRSIQGKQIFRGGGKKSIRRRDGGIFAVFNRDETNLKRFHRFIFGELAEIGKFLRSRSCFINRIEIMDRGGLGLYFLPFLPMKRFFESFGADNTILVKIILKYVNLQKINQIKRFYFSSFNLCI